jgi:hypothetical protein
MGPGSTPGSRNHGSAHRLALLRRRKTSFRDSPHIRTESTGAMQSAQAALSREVGDATEMLLTKAEQVSDDGACAAGLRLKRP